MFVGSFAPVNSAGQLKDDSGPFRGISQPTHLDHDEATEMVDCPKGPPPDLGTTSPTHLWHPSVNTEFDVGNPPGFCMDFPNGYVIYPKVSQLGMAARQLGPKETYGNLLVHTSSLSQMILLIPGTSQITIIYIYRWYMALFYPLFTSFFNLPR